MTILIESTYTPSTDEATYRLLCEKHGFKSVAGPRLFRGGEHPKIKWTYTDQAEAFKEAKVLQDYLDGALNKISKAKARKEGA